MGGGGGENGYTPVMEGKLLDLFHFEGVHNL